MYTPTKAIDKLIRKGGDPILKQKCNAVERGEPMPFLETLERVCRKAPGLGLAAPQIGVAKRVIFTLCPNSKGIIAGRVMVNPMVLAKSEEKSTEREGCLSFPGVYRSITRPKAVRVAWEDALRRSHEAWFGGIEARVIQHELDHLDGICRVGDPSLSFSANPSHWPDPADETLEPALIS